MLGLVTAADEVAVMQAQVTNLNYSTLGKDFGRHRNWKFAMFGLQDMHVREESHCEGVVSLKLTCCDDIVAVDNMANISLRQSHNPRYGSRFFFFMSLF